MNPEVNGGAKFRMPGTLFTVVATITEVDPIGQRVHVAEEGYAGWVPYEKVMQFMDVSEFVNYRVQRGLDLNGGSHG